MKIVILQLLCPNRHCITGSPYDADSHPAADMEELVRLAIRESGANWRCGICGSTELRFEHGPTGFTKMEDAYAAMLKSALEQLMTRAFLDAKKETFDSNFQSN